MQRYNLGSSENKFIRHNENMTFRVDGKYLLRIHRSANGFNAETHYVDVDRNVIYKSEMDSLIHLKKYGMSVQMPIANLNGEFLTVLSDGTSADIHRFSRSFKPNHFISYNSAFCSCMKNRL